MCMLFVLRTRKAGLRGLCGVIKKTEGDESLQLNIWEPADMNKIVPPFLFNLQDSAGISPRCAYQKGRLQGDAQCVHF